jgi:hypothetical protein
LKRWELIIYRERAVVEKRKHTMSRGGAALG